ncbi:MAG: hypothetical protein HZA19_05420 [Nitrospirae bacterium]|nr:hypothetical protein [Nitrospirota bacterium]
MTTETGPGWSTPVPVTTSQGFNSFRMAMDKDGSVLMVYSRWDDASALDRVFAKGYHPGSGWEGNETAIDGDSSEDDATRPVAAFDPSGSGNAIALFIRGGRVYAHWYRKEAGWEGSVTPIDNPADGVSDDPQAAFDSSGNVIAVFRQGEGIRSARFNAMTSVWDSPVLLSSVSLGTSVSPKIGFIGSGYFWVTFYQWTDSGTTQGYRLYATFFDRTSWDPVPERIDSDFHNFFDAAMASDGFGNAMVVFSEGAGNKMIARRYFKEWMDPQTLGTSTGKALDLAYDSSHNVTILFIQKDGSDIDRVFAAKYTNNPGSWAEATAIDTSEGNADNPRIAFDSSDRGIQVFSKEAAGVPGIFAVHGTPEAGWGNPIQIDGNTASGASLPQMAMDWDGKSMVLFARPDPGSGQIYATRYE